MSTALVIDIIDLYQKTFGRKPYVVPGISDGATDSSANGYKVSDKASNGADKNDYKILSSATNAEKEFTAKGSLLKEQYNGVEIMLPVRLYQGPKMLLYMPYCVIAISGGKNIIETQLSERQGSVKELFNINDYKINIKGFLIAPDRKYPEEQIQLLRILFETQTAITIENALTNIFLTDPALPYEEQRRVVVTSFELPEVSGGKESAKPFTLSLQSDIVFTLELKD